MKRFSKSMLGVTLLEIMLVLAIAAMIIVMSIRYYQAANQSQQANSFLEQVQGITATVESLAIGSGTYSTITTANLQTMLPGGVSALNAPWGGAITFTANTNGFTLAVPAPSTPTCTLITKQLSVNNHYTVDGSCATVTYIANP